MFATGGEGGAALPESGARRIGAGRRAFPRTDIYMCICICIYIYIYIYMHTNNNAP